MKDTKERILTEGLSLLTRDGFAGVTLGVLAQKTGVSKSGLFAHFGSKEEMQLGLLERMTAVGAASFVSPAMLERPGLARLSAVVHGWLGWTVKAGLAGGCPVAAGMFELDDADLENPLRQRLLAMEARWRGLLVQLTRDSVETGELRADLDAEQFVWELCGIYLNHHATYRFLRDPMANERALRAFGALIERSASGSGERRGDAPRNQLGDAAQVAGDADRPGERPDSG